jgi:hypothetical protein
MGIYELSESCELLALKAKFKIMKYFVLLPCVGLLLFMQVVNLVNSIWRGDSYWIIYNSVAIVLAFVVLIYLIFLASKKDE